MKYYLISGETSGDQHAAKVIDQLKLKDSNARFRGIGGDRSEQAGLTLFLHQKSIAFMGFVEVLLHLFTILRTIKQTKKDILLFKPDRILLVDYPGFNLKIARFANAHHIPVHYYIAPKLWAWKESRIKLLKKYTDRVYSILPFEVDYFRERGLEVHYVGNPSKAEISQNPNLKDNKRTKLIALLPGSRKQEITKNLALMMGLKKHFPSYEFAVAQAPGFNHEFYKRLVPNVELETNMHQLLASADLAVVTSGTATLETALLNVPQVVCYRTSSLTYMLAKRFIKIPYISLVNIILDKPAVTELIQKEFNLDRTVEELNALISGAKREQMLEDYIVLNNTLGNDNPAEKVSEGLLH